MVNILRQIQTEASRLSADEERRLVGQAQRGSAGARRALLLAYLPLVARLAREQMRPTLELGDLIGAGVVALGAAIRTIDPDRATRLSSYAYLAVVRAIRQEVDFARRIVRLPRPAEMSYGRRKDTIRPDARRVQQREAALRRCLSLEAGELPLGRLLADPRDERAELERREELSWLRERLQELPQRERAAIEAKYLRQGTLDELGPRFGCGRKAGSKWHRRAIERLRRLAGQRT